MCQLTTNIFNILNVENKPLNSKLLNKKSQHTKHRIPVSLIRRGIHNHGWSKFFFISEHTIRNLTSFHGREGRGKSAPSLSFSAVAPVSRVLENNTIPHETPGYFFKNFKSFFFLFHPFSRCCVVALEYVIRWPDCTCFLPGSVYKIFVWKKGIEKKYYDFIVQFPNKCFYWFNRSSWWWQGWDDTVKINEFCCYSYKHTLKIIVEYIFSLINILRVISEGANRKNPTGSRGTKLGG